MKIFSKVTFFLLFLIQISTTLLGKIEQDLALLETELTILASILPKISLEKEPIFEEEKKEEQIPEFRPEDFKDIEIEPSFFKEENSLFFPGIATLNKGLAEISQHFVHLADSKKEKLDKQKIKKEELYGKAKKTIEALKSKLSPSEEKANEDNLKKLIATSYELGKEFPLTISALIDLLAQTNQYSPSRVFQMLGKILSPSVSKFNQEVKKEISRNALTMADQTKRTQQREYIKESFTDALFTINLVLDEYDKYKENKFISNFDKNQLLDEILFNWQSIKNGLEGINELSDEDKREILDSIQSLPIITDPGNKEDKNLNNYFEETRERIEGAGKAEGAIKPLKILLGKIQALLTSPTEVTENAVKNFVIAQVPATMNESSAFLNYNYSEFDNSQKKLQVIKMLKAASKSAIKGTKEAKILINLAQEIKIYGLFRQNNDEIEYLIQQMKKDETQFASTEIIENIIEKIDKASEASENLNDSNIKRDKNVDKELKQGLEKAKKAINIAQDIAPALTGALTDFCAPFDVQNQIDFHVKGKKVSFSDYGKEQGLQKQKYSDAQEKAIELYKNASQKDQILILQSIISSLIKKCKEAIKCAACTGDAVTKLSEEVLKFNYLNGFNTPGWIQEKVSGEAISDIFQMARIPKEHVHKSEEEIDVHEIDLM